VNKWLWARRNFWQQKNIKNNKNTPFGAEQKHDSSLSTVRKSVHDILQRLQFDMCLFVEKEEWLITCKFATRTKALTHINKQRNFAKSAVKEPHIIKRGQQHEHFTRKGGSAHHKNCKGQTCQLSKYMQTKNLPHGISMSGACKIKIKICFLKIHDYAEYATPLSFVFLPSDKVQDLVKVPLDVTCRCSTHRVC